MNATTMNATTMNATTMNATGTVQGHGGRQRAVTAVQLVISERGYVYKGTLGGPMT
jgi:hypothetical protein